ncbi:hypothetical protein D3C79_962840 [compost metagenome]
MLQGTHHRFADLVEILVQRIADGFGVAQQARGQGAVFDGHDDVIGLAQALEVYHLFVGRQAQAHQLIGRRRVDAALQPLRAWGKAFQAEHFAEARQA